MFAGWSDGISTSARDDLITKDLSVTARFKKLFDGDGTKENPFVISSNKEFQNMQYYPNAYYELSSDLNLLNTIYEPIFSESNKFQGKFDGNDHTIKNMTINTETNLPSLFGYVGINGEITNLKMTDVEINIPHIKLTDRPLCVGAIASVSFGKLSNIVVSGSIFGEGLNFGTVAIGGLVGQTINLVESCSSNFNINLDNIGLSQDKFALDVGGLIGVVGGDVKNCSSFGQINLNSKENSNPNARILGGLIGTYADTYPITEMNVINCISSVNILSNFAAYCAGLIGYVETAIKFNVLECSANGNISTTGNGAGGGLLGYFFAEDNSIIADCYSSGNIEIAGFGAGFAEQIKGYYGALKIKNCYSLGNVSGGGRNAGFALEVKAEMKNCYSTGNVISFGISSGFIYSFEGTLEKCYNVGKVVSGCRFYLSNQFKKLRKSY